MSIMESIPAMEVKVKPVRGFIRVELFDAETKELIRRVEKENLVTNAIQTGIQAYAATNQINDFMPIATVGLGGIMLFDDTLDADADNILFPAGAHITGFALQNVNTDNTLMGSKNVSESLVQKGAEGRSRTVWDFGTSQANGVIKSVALTRSVNPFRPAYGLGEIARVEYYSGSSYNTYSSKAVLAYEDGYAYICHGVSYNTTKTGENYTTTYTMSIYKEYCPMGVYKVGDDPTWRQGCPNELVQTVTWAQTTENRTELYAHEFIRVDYGDADESAYLIWSRGNSSGNGKLLVTKITRDGLTWSADDTEEITCAGVQFATWYGVPVNGFYVMVSYDGASFYKVNMDNPQDIRQIPLPDGWKVRSYDSNRSTEIYGYGCGNVCPARGGAVYFTAETVRTNGTQSKKVYRPAILYPDGIIKLYGADYGSSDYPYTYISYACANGYAFGDDKDSYVEGRYLSNYLGTVANLPSPITKNASQTLKITYTLVDV